MLRFGLQFVAKTFTNDDFHVNFMCRVPTKDVFFSTMVWPLGYNDLTLLMKLRVQTWRMKIQNLILLNPFGDPVH
jgi:hypothetical protein